MHLVLNAQAFFVNENLFVHSGKMYILCGLMAA